MDTKYYIIRPSGEWEEGNIDWPKEPGYELIRDLVEPIVDGPLEHVAVLYKDRRADMFVDELGHVRGIKKEHNEEATKIYQTNWLKIYPGTNPDTLPSIVGTVVLFDRIVWF